MSLTSILGKVVDFSLILHVIAGLGSIILFWIPIFTRKGGSTHRKIGKAYIILMWIVIFSGIVLTIHKYDEGEMDAAIFLGFLVFLAARPIWYGTAILKPNQYSVQQLKLYHIILRLILFFYGIFMLVHATYSQDESVTILMIVFGTLGIFAGLDAWTIPETAGTYTLYLNAYDAGSEANDEILGVEGSGATGVAGIPANPSGVGSGTNGTGAAEADTNTTVHIHRGVLGDTDPDGGASDLDSRIHRWLNPVAKVVVTVQ